MFLTAIELNVQKLNLNSICMSNIWLHILSFKNMDDKPIRAIMIIISLLPLLGSEKKIHPQRKKRFFSHIGIVCSWLGKMQKGNQKAIFSRAFKQSVYSTANSQNETEKHATKSWLFPNWILLSANQNKGYILLVDHLDLNVSSINYISNTCVSLPSTQCLLVWISCAGRSLHIP